MFLDEVSFDNRGMIRKRGYSLRGTRVMIRGEFTRKPRVSLLSFINVNGLVSTFMTEGTFNRSKFFSNIKELIASGVVQQYPGKNSIWILDGAKIHCHDNIVYYLRLCGIVPIFLPAYCPFYNPIGIMFGIVKSRMQRDYIENKVSNSNLPLFVAAEMDKFVASDLSDIYRKCGYLGPKKFHLGLAYAGDDTDLGFE
jgi:transposase